MQKVNAPNAIIVGLYKVIGLSGQSIRLTVHANLGNLKRNSSIISKSVLFVCWLMSLIFCRFGWGNECQ